MSDNFAKPVSGLGVPALGTLDVAAYPTAGQGLSLGANGRVPTSTLARVITGFVSSAGAVNAGTGFTVTHLGTGRYQINFASPFTAAPVVVVTTIPITGNEAVSINAPTTSMVQVNVNNGGVAADCGFSFFVREMV